MNDAERKFVASFIIYFVFGLGYLFIIATFMGLDIISTLFFSYPLLAVFLIIQFSLFMSFRHYFQYLKEEDNRRRFSAH